MRASENKTSSRERGGPKVIAANAPAARGVLVIEELAAIRELLSRFIDSLAGFRVVGTAGSWAEVKDALPVVRPEIALIDWMVLSESGDENLARAIRQLSPATRVVVFSAGAEPHFVGEAISAGVSGFVVKSAGLETLVTALNAVAEGKQFFCPEMAGVLRELLQKSSAPAVRGGGLLTPRERDVLREIAKGHFTKEIASQFNLTVFAVENIRRRIMRKTGLKSVAELTLHAVKLRLVAPSSRGGSGGGGV